MKFCQPHWDKLRDAIKERGIFHLVAKDGKEAISQAIRQIEGKDDARKDYDPLMSAHWQIVENAMKVFGLDVIFGETCPLCFLDGHQEGAPPDNKADDWIKNAADTQLGYAKQMGLQG